MQDISNISFNEKARSEEEQKKLQTRLNRIIGQINGIKNMIADNRCCEDVLVQVSAAESAVRSFGYAIFEEHLSTTVAEHIKANDEGIIGEAMELIKRL